MELFSANIVKHSTKKDFSNVKDATASGTFLGCVCRDSPTITVNRVRQPSQTADFGYVLIV